MITKFSEYIKENNSAYSELSDEEYLELKFLKNPAIDISDGDMSRILKMFQKLIDNKIVRYYIIPSNIKIASGYATRRSLKLTYDDDKKFLTIDIYKLDDDWFLTSLFEQDVEVEDSRVGARINSLGTEELYKCDQLYGLESLLRDKGII
jgi:hypothetical protein